MSRTRPIMKRSREDTESQFRALAAKKKRLAGQVQPLRPLTKNPIAQQTIRVGGWANPSGGGELKYIDSGFNALNGSESAIFSIGDLLNGVIPGSDATQRIGRKITMKSLQIRWRLGLNPDATELIGGVNGRILIVYDKQANATAPAITDILTLDNFNSNLNLNNRDRFVVLMDKLTDPISKEGDASVCGKKFIRLNNEVVFNSGNTAVIGAIQTGSVYGFFATTPNAQFATAGSIVFSCITRIRFSDM